MARTGIRQVIGLGILTASLVLAQPAKTTSAPVVTVEQPDAQRTRDQLSQLLEHYPPNLRSVFALDPTLLSNQAYLAPYPALANFLTTHPEIVSNPSFYVGGINDRRFNQQNTSTSRERIWERVIENLFMVAGFGMAIGVVTWLIRTAMDYRRWSRLSKVQTDVHTKLLDRLTGHEELLAYIQSPAGAKFLESSPITLDPGPRNVGAPLGRILWSVQAGLVSIAAGGGMQVMAGRFSNEVSEPFHAMGVLGVALGLGFVISAIISFVISQRLGLIETPASRVEPPVRG